MKKFEFLLSKKFEILLLRKNLQLFSRADFRLLGFLFKKEILEGNDFFQEVSGSMKRRVSAIVFNFK